MKHAIIALVAAVILATAQAAGADPTPQEQATAFTIARDYWATQQPATGGMPACGWPTITYGPIPSTNGPDEGMALLDSCTILIDPAYTADPVTYCMVMVHEVGHFILGPTYFEATNPTDPAHSTDPTSPMYPTLGGVGQPNTLAPCIATLPPPTGPPAPICSAGWVCPAAHKTASTTRARAVAANRRALRAMRRSQRRAHSHTTPHGRES